MDADDAIAEDSFKVKADKICCGDADLNPTLPINCSCEHKQVFHHRAIQQNTKSEVPINRAMEDNSSTPRFTS